MEQENDTDVLLAMLSSLLRQPIPDEASLLDALVECNGDVSSAAKLLQSRSQTFTQPSTPKAPLNKRKRSSTSLDQWLQSPSASGISRSLHEPGSSHDHDHKNWAPAANHTRNDRTYTVPGSKSQIDFRSMFRAPPPSKGPVLPRLTPLTLASPMMVAKHTSCTLHYSVLPPELACDLFYNMMDESDHWSRNKWWLFDRLVESPHRTSFFVRESLTTGEKWKEETQFWYNGRMTEPAKHFPPYMEQACKYIETVVNDELRKRKRFPLEWGGSADTGEAWHANVAASNRYEGGKESVGPHSDQLTYLGPFTTIASLSLGTERRFRLREVIHASESEKRHARTYNIPLPHNSLVIMHASTQERFKHSIPPQSVIDSYRPAYPRAPGQPIEPSNSRINITFRFYRPDFRAETTPRCKCDVPMILRPDMKHWDSEGQNAKYWWTCYSGAQNEGKGCNLWKVMDAEAEGRGPFAGEIR